MSERRFQSLGRSLPHTLSSMPQSATSSEMTAIPPDRLTVERRSHDMLVVRVRSAGSDQDRLPDAVFSFRCGDPQYAYWLARIAGHGGEQARAARS